nr:hypothetical protein [Bacteroidota bacterium]
MDKKLLLITFTVISLSAFAVHDNRPEGGRSASLANASVAFSDFWSIQNNQAGLAFYNRLSAGVYFENRFLVKEMSLKAGGFVLPTKAGTFGASLSYFGYPKYNETKIGLAYAKNFGGVIAIGVQLDYLGTSIADNYGQKGVATIEIGILSKINENLYLGAHVFNPVRAKISDYNDERIPTIFRVGSVYHIDKNLLVTAEVEKDLEYDPMLKLGMEYRIIKQVIVRGGVSTNPGIYSFGFGLDFDKLMIDFSSTIHEVLGYSPQISLIYNFR